MGKASRDKGLRRERALVEIHKQSGIAAERVPLSGATHYRGNGADIDIYGRGGNLKRFPNRHQHPGCDSADASQAQAAPAPWPLRQASSKSAPRNPPALPPQDRR